MSNESGHANSGTEQIEVGLHHFTLGTIDRLDGYKERLYCLPFFLRRIIILRKGDFAIYVTHLFEID